MCNLLNPKAAVIFTSILPQFVVAREAAAPQLAVLGAIFVALIVIWLSLYSVLAAGVTSTFGSRVRRAITATTGLVLVALGIRLATD